MDEARTAVATCTSCCATEVRACAVRSAFWEGERLVVVEDIPALVCAACGERFYDDATVMALDLLRGEGFREESSSGTIRVPVFSFRNRVTEREKA
jgi:YgiT-type zinc finger domain-containing protein